MCLILMPVLYIYTIIIIIVDNKSLQQELTSPLTIMQLDKIVKIEKEVIHNTYDQCIMYCFKKGS